MNIYEEAIKEVKMFFNDEDWVHKSIMPKTIKALEHAKKEHELLELHREHKKLVPFTPGLGKDSKRVIDISIEIKALEEELK